MRPGVDPLYGTDHYWLTRIGWNRRRVLRMIGLAFVAAALLAPAATAAPIRDYHPTTPIRDYK